MKQSEYLPLALLVAIIIVIIKSILGYKRYKKICVVYRQESKPIGYAKNVLVDTLGVSTIVVMCFVGYFGLSNTVEEEQKYLKTQKTKEVTSAFTIRKVVPRKTSTKSQSLNPK